MGILSNSMLEAFINVVNIDSCSDKIYALLILFSNVDDNHTFTKTSIWLTIQIIFFIGNFKI